MKENREYKYFPFSPLGLKSVLPACILFILILSSALISCKKRYPENKGIHLKKPENRIIGKYYITQYTVNGADSMPLLSLKFNKDISKVEWNFVPEGRDYAIYKAPHNYEFPVILYEFRNNKTELAINYFVYLGSTSSFYNMFTKEGYSTWKIMKLYTKNKIPTLKIKREYNGKTYIIQYN